MLCHIQLLSTLHRKAIIDFWKESHSSLATTFLKTMMPRAVLVMQNGTAFLHGSEHYQRLHDSIEVQTSSKLVHRCVVCLQFRIRYDEKPTRHTLPLLSYFGFAM